jgi:hypothetical protein
MKKIFEYFKKTEIKQLSPVLSEYINRKKIVTFVPLGSVDKLTFDMASAGAGAIGNYTVCSFRMKGIGTFMPGKSAKPFSGKKGKISFEEEVRLEMECGINDLESVIEVLIKSHPYEEPAYEIYDFQKRTDKKTAFLCELKKKVSLEELIYRLNNKVVIAEGYSGLKFSKLLIIDSVDKDYVLKSLEQTDAEVLITLDKNKNNINII